MNDLITRLATEAGAAPLKAGVHKGTLVLAGGDIEAFAALVAKACARACEDRATAYGNANVSAASSFDVVQEVDQCADTIREMFPMPPAPPVAKATYGPPTYYDLSQTYRLKENRQPSAPTASAGTSKD